MPSYVKSMTVDCAAGDAIRLATFWATALGGEVDEDATGDRAFVEAPGWGGPNLWFAAVPEPKAVKNRWHLDLRAPDSDVAAEVARLRDAGATVLRDGADLVVMQDPAGNEFCVET